MNTRYRILVLACLTFTSGALAAQSTDSQTLQKEILELIQNAGPNDTYEELLGKVDELLQAAKESGSAQATSEAQLAVNARAAASPGTVTAPDGFAGRVNDSLSNFLPFFGFAINGITTSEDGESAVISLNPLDVGGGAIQITATLAKPTPAEKLLESVEQSARSSTQEAMEDQLDDFSDLTWSATYAYQRSDEGVTWSDGKHLFGRSANLYENVLSELMQSVWEQAYSGKTATAIASMANWEVEIDDRISPVNGDVTDVKLSAIRERFTPSELRQISAALASEALSPFTAALRDNSIDTLASLVANQPQLTFTATRRDRAQLAGPRSSSYTLKYELGRANLNRVMSRYRRMSKANERLGKDYTVLDAYNWGKQELKSQKESRYSFSYTYADRDQWSPQFDYDLELTDPTSGETSSLPRTAMAALASDHEWCVKVAWSRNVLRQSHELRSAPETEMIPFAQDVPARIGFSLEHVDVGSSTSKQNRQIAKLSYSLPLNDGLSVPFTLTYANKNEFLGEQDEILNAHIGLSYSLPAGKSQ